MQTTGGRFTAEINGRTYKGRGKATIETARVEVAAEANQDGSAFRTVKPKLASCDLTFDRGVGLKWDEALILSDINLTFVETDAKVTHLFTDASWVGTPSLDTETGEVSGLSIKSDKYQQV
ncbi:phage tail tube protein [Methylobacterium sp. CCH5-D2]|uniref:phage tail tube protein n=1 Tax=Methylobacterium sp. CCH5-D2 TaxID=1768765 RepID=UPI00082972B9|nr:phage tail tube protein [Methylobacterium sp. CCH5-D2]